MSIAIIVFIFGILIALFDGYYLALKDLKDDHSKISTITPPTTFTEFSSNDWESFRRLSLASFVRALQNRLNASYFFWWLVTVVITLILVTIGLILSYATPPTTIPNLNILSSDIGSYVLNAGIAAPYIYWLYHKMMIMRLIKMSRYPNLYI